MPKRPLRRVLFTGYAPVHFVCFQPLYERLRRTPGVEVYVSGGREPAPDRPRLTARSLYAPFRLPANRVLTLGQIARRTFDLVFCAHVSGYLPRNDYGRVQLFHGISFRNMAVRRDVLVYDHLFTVGPYMRRAFVEQKLLRDHDPKLLEIGMPKLDRLVDGSLDRRAVLRRHGLTGRRPVILYAPTGQKDNSLEHTGEEVIRRLRKTNRYDVLIKLHDHPRNRDIDWVQQLQPLLDRHTRLVEDFDIIPSLFAADLLITDASSVSCEYTLLDRPIVFLDVPQMIRSMQRKGVALDLDTWGRKAGVLAKWPDEAVEAVEWSLAHPRRHGSLRRQMARDLFYHPGHATDTAMRWVTAQLDLPERT